MKHAVLPVPRKKTSPEAVAQPGLSMCCDRCVCVVFASVLECVVCLCGVCLEYVCMYCLCGECVSVGVCAMCVR